MQSQRKSIFLYPLENREMKRELDCLKCGEKMKGLLEKNKSIGEPFKILIGKLKVSNLVCDSCDKGLKVGEEVFAISQWLTKSGGKYQEWEKTYITL